MIEPPLEVQMPGRKKRILVVVVDGGAARFFEASRLGGAVAELEDRRLRAPTPPLPASKPVRVHDRFGPGRHSNEARQAPRAAAETRFLSEVAAAIDPGVDQFDEVVLCAPPRALGVLRAHLSDSVRARLSREVARDYVRETPERLSALLASA
jgi:protein required for attachment to host cells